ncbi:Transmembrane protein 62 [Smittium mucronatum]|uniref:Transmembrane protein 62 n=1 Tax=Smittium mucronatum TaxID=133383 RepID=A0A1R0GSJ3_9FUNG|nr:Transmembrane protein 62 [Smittium mucronatum]
MNDPSYFEKVKFDFPSSIPNPINSLFNDPLPRKNSIQASNNNDLSESKMDDRPGQIFTFVQISDLHISKFAKSGGVMHLLLFLKQALPIISPRHLFITGDLTDAKDVAGLSSAQQLEEWESYNSILNDFNLRERNNGSFAFDQRGNHDCFNVESWDSYQNFYSKFSLSKTTGYVLKSQFNNKNYCFVATDGCPKRGFGRPMNFFGYLNSNDVKNTADAIDTHCRSSEHVFMLNHYPTAVMRYGNLKRNVDGHDLTLNKVSAFLCGHLHLLAGGIGDDLKAQRKDFLELELGDMKLNALYRIFAIDNGIVSFVDVTLPIQKLPLANPEPSDPLSVIHSDIFKNGGIISQPPIILVTNPKETKYFIKSREDFDLIVKSKSIRMLIYSFEKIESVSAYIDSMLIGHPQTKLEFVKVSQRSAKFANSNYEPLYTIDWDPSLYMDSKTHNLTIVAVSSSGENQKLTSYKTIMFNLDVKKAPLPLNNFNSGGFVMGIDFYKTFKNMSFILYILGVFVFLLVPKLISEQFLYKIRSEMQPIAENTDFCWKHLLETNWKTTKITILAFWIVGCDF